MSQPNSRREMWARIILLFATAMWGLSFSLVKALRGGFTCGTESDFETSAAFVFVRFGLSFLIFPLWMWKSLGKPSRQEFAMGAYLGIVGGMGLLFQSDGLAYTDPGTSAFLTQMSCILVPFVALIRRRRKIGKLFLATMAFGLCGIYLIAGFDPKTFSMGRGEAETLMCAMFFSWHILLIETRRWKHLINLRSTWIMFLFFSLVNLPFFRWKSLCFGGEIGYSPTVILSFMAVLVIFCSLLPFSLMNLWQPVISGTEASFIYSLESVFAVLFNFLLIPLMLHFERFPLTLEFPSLKFSIGAVLLLAANFFLFAESRLETKKLGVLKGPS